MKVDVDEIMGLLYSDDVLDRRNAVDLLAHDLSDESLELMKIPLDDLDWHVRWDVAVDLRRFGKRAVPMLLDAAKDEHTTVREAATWSLFAIGAKGALIVLSETGSSHVRRLSRRMLREI